ncbi:MAG TPA: hypothetical protein VKN82_10205 [Desulfohalobiaceae bacterium]|nr:hypothetical protein [Desulfohalobiaceae bacterium]
MSYDIQLVKLINGDMALGKLDKEKGQLKDPAILQTVPTQQGSVQMALLPFGYPFDMEIQGEISLDHVIYYYKNIPDDLKNKYFEASSNLTLSSSNDLQNLQNLTGQGQQRGGNVTNISDLFKT